MKILLKGIVVFVSLLIVVIVASFIYILVEGKIANNEALVKAKAYCERFKVGEKLGPQFNTTERTGGYYFYDEDTATHRMVFHGFIYDSAQCQVAINNGDIVSKAVVMVHD